MKPSRIFPMFLVLLLAADVLAQNDPPTPPTTTNNNNGNAANLPPGLSDGQKNDIKKLLNEAIVKGKERPIRIVCSATSLTCTPPAVFISAAVVSAIEIEDLPKNKNSLTVQITANENDENGEPITVVRRFDKPWIPDRITIGVNKDRRFNPTYATEGVTEKAKTGKAKTGGSQENNGNRNAGADDHTAEKKSMVRKYMENQSTPGATITAGSSGTGNATIPPQSPGIGFVSRGSAEWLYIQIQADSDAPQSIAAGLNYQRWFVDMGGFITFGFVSDEELVTEDATPAGNVRVVKKRHKDKIVPGTGIVLNFHPANYPALAAQFGIATSVDRAASYYLGFGYRLRQLGPNTLATFAVGIAATQVKRFPDVSVGDIRSATAPAITQGSNRYAFGPYFSLSLGFSFGGVDQPTTPPNSSNGGNSTN